MSEPRIVCGVEVHLQLSTRTKAFCSCPVEFGAEPNTLCCPVCLGHPGALPVLNRAALEAALRGGLALGCSVAPRGRTLWDRKNYFYPDLPKGYQITQYEFPLCEDGALPLSDGTRVRVRRAHLEEDTGKSSHAEHGETLIDFNRCGVPLLEIVTEPDLRTPAEVEEYLRLLQDRMRLAGASECSMEKGQMRCEPNVSLARPDGSSTGISELKNLNSFAAARDAVAFEAKRLADGPWHPKGTAPPRATYGWDDGAKRTILQRTKETAADYRYFQEPDLPVLPAEALAPLAEAARAFLAGKEKERRDSCQALDLEIQAYIAQGIDPATAKEIVKRESNLHPEHRTMAVTASCLRPRDRQGMTLLAKLRQGPVAAWVKAHGGDESRLKARGEPLADLVGLIVRGEATLEVVKNHMLQGDWLGTDLSPRKVLEEAGLLGAAAGEDALRATCAEVVKGNPDVVAKIKGGKPQAKAALVGQVMKAMRGKADAARVNGILDDLLGT